MSLRKIIKPLTESLYSAHAFLCDLDIYHLMFVLVVAIIDASQMNDMLCNKNNLTESISLDNYVYACMFVTIMIGNTINLS